MSELPFALALVTVGALLLDRVFGEPRFHPLVWFGNAASSIDRRLNTQSARWQGVVALLIVVVPPVVLVIAVQQLAKHWLIVDVFFHLCILMFVIGWQSMKEHARAIVLPLTQDNLPQAQLALAMIVSRDTANMDESAITGSVIESILENGHDSVFASLFWFAILGPAGAIAHRLVNTLDAMWGYRNERYLKFGWAAARADDLLGYVPARLTAISYAICGHTRQALDCWRRQSPMHKSPNAGVVMAAGAGALNVKIGGPTRYDGVLQDKPDLGVGPRATIDAIESSITLVQKALLVWIAIFACGGLARTIFL